MRAVILLENVNIGVEEVKCACFAALESDSVVSVLQTIEMVP